MPKSNSSKFAIHNVASRSICMYFLRSRIIEESNDCSRARIFAQVSAEATAAGEGSAHRHQIAESPVVQQQQQQENPNTATSVSQVNLGTTRAGRVRQRIQWTTEMNEYVLRCYYISTNCEEPEHMTTYRERMLDLFLRRYRHLNGKLTENSLATRKKAIFQHEYVRKEKQEEIKSAIRNELRGVEGSEEEITPEITEARNPQPEDLAEFPNVQPELNLIYESIESDGPETNEEWEVKDIFLNYLANYEGMDPLLRPRIPRLGESEKLNEVVKTLNSKILPAYVANSTNLEYVNTLFYVSALTTVRLLGKHPKVQTFKNKTTQKTPVVPRWQRRLETRIAGLRESIGRLTSFKNGAKSKRLLRHVSSIITPLKPQTVGLDQLSEIIDRKVQQLAAYSKRLRRYLKSNQRRKENQLFHKNQKSFYRNLQQNSNAESQILYPQQQELEQFWEKIWAQAKLFNADANWLAKEKEKADNVAPMHFYDITAEEIKNNIYVRPALLPPTTHEKKANTEVTQLPSAAAGCSSTQMMNGHGGQFRFAFAFPFHAFKFNFN
ncbi:uncharacterized protein LOC128867184 [Anastrepha ludens]|uniref:uncharacterized protein LOC128867184 n=1 Tax=Anastrepha ludens TaxID=28586 RepID=UPI0023B13CFF|nr:uncharacterized protein LOC128867184 [Anastrepha ludens]